jgi:general L-amino acid transport system permease protein
MAIQDIAAPPVARKPAVLSLLYQPQVRGIAFQVIVAVTIVVLVIWMVDNTIDNLRRANIASGFGFLETRSGFEISQKLVSFSSDASYGRALLVGLLNTLLVAALGIVFASILGFITGVARLSKNWLISRIALVYVEIFRNVPILLQLLFWYKAVLSVLPGPRQGSCCRLIPI